MSDIARGPQPLDAMTYGLELEKPFSHQDGDSFGVGPAYFDRLEATKRERGEDPTVKRISGVAVGVTTVRGEESLDNGFNLGESATGPITGAEGGLNRLNEIVNQELADVIDAVEADGGMVLNMSCHPMTGTDLETYSKYVAPKPAYGFVRDVRGWAHNAGISAQAQNSPSFGVRASEAIPAVNVMIGLGSSLIAMYANSPFEQGRVTGSQESRAAVWSRIFGGATLEGDKRLAAAPDQPFGSMRDYFNWMFGAGTNMFFVTQTEGDVKASEQPVVVEGSPPLLDFMAGESWTGTVYGTGESVQVRPELGHLAMHQFMQFSGARIRYGLRPDTAITAKDFTSAMAAGSKEVDALFEKMTDFVYIEGRDPGANFADQETIDRSPASARSVVISPAAIQTGLLRNLSEAEALVGRYGWDDLMALRQQAAIDGLDAIVNNVSVKQLCEDVLAVAERGLQPDEQWMLAYPKEVVATGRNGAVRALEMLATRTEATEADRIRGVARQRRAIAYSE